jgi:hypothetical protein
MHIAGFSGSLEAGSCQVPSGADSAHGQSGQFLGYCGLFEHCSLAYTCKSAGIAKRFKRLLSRHRKAIKDLC